MDALGFVETRGLLSAIESADVMLKAAQVSLVEKTLVGGGLVSITVTGDVSAVKAAVEAGAEAVKRIDEQLLVSKHVIPRPHEELTYLFNESDEVDGEVLREDHVESLESVESEEIEETSSTEEESQKAEQDDVETTNEIDHLNEEPLKEVQKEETEQKEQKIDFDKVNKNTIDEMVFEKGIDETVQLLNKLKVTELRKLAREYKDFGIKGRAISNASKKTLLEEFKKYYEKKD